MKILYHNIDNKSSVLCFLKQFCKKNISMAFLAGKTFVFELLHYFYLNLNISYCQVIFR